MQKENFQQIAKNYSTIHKNSLLGLSDMDFKYFIKYKIDIIKDKISEEPKTLLDFGCGIGYSSSYISKLFPETQITGIDTDSFSIESCKKLNIPNSTFYNIDITTQDLPNNKYDLILSSCVMHHIPPENRKTVLEKLLNSLNKNGKLFIFEHNPYNLISYIIFKKSVIDKGCFMVSSKQLKLITQEINKKDIKLYPAKYTLFIPRFKFLEKTFFLERYLEKIPIGCQYYVILEKYV